MFRAVNQRLILLPSFYESIQIFQLIKFSKNSNYKKATFQDSFVLGQVVFSLQRIQKQKIHRIHIFLFRKIASENIDRSAMFSFDNINTKEKYLRLKQSVIIGKLTRSVAHQFHIDFDKRIF